MVLGMLLMITYGCCPFLSSTQVYTVYTYKYNLSQYKWPSTKRKCSKQHSSLTALWIVFCDRYKKHTAKSEWFI